MEDVIYSYSLDQAIDDGILVEVFKPRWNKLSGGRPIVATAHLFGDISLAGLMEIWNEYVEWRKNIMASLPEEAQMFATTMDGEKVCIIEDGYTFTMMYPEDY